MTDDLAPYLRDLTAVMARLARAMELLTLVLDETLTRGERADVLRALREGR